MSGVDQLLRYGKGSDHWILRDRILYRKHAVESTNASHCVFVLLRIAAIVDIIIGVVRKTLFAQFCESTMVSPRNNSLSNITVTFGENAIFIYPI